MSWLQPPFINYITMCLYALNVTHHLMHWKLDGAAYWAAALAITAAVTWQKQLAAL